MVMIKCPECKTKCSEKAKNCPKCGYNFQKNKKDIIVYLVLALFLGLLGAHRFYAGKKQSAIVMLLCGTIGWLLIIPGIVVCWWALIDIIIAVCNLNTPEQIFDNDKE